MEKMLIIDIPSACKKTKMVLELERYYEEIQVKVICSQSSTKKIKIKVSLMYFKLKITS